GQCLDDDPWMAFRLAGREDENIRPSQQPKLFVADRGRMECHGKPVLCDVSFASPLCLGVVPRTDHVQMEVLCTMAECQVNPFDDVVDAFRLLEVGEA